jgi:hypothetical protein
VNIAKLQDVSSSAESSAAIRTCNRSLTKKRALSFQVRDPHDRDHVPVIIRLLFCVLVASPGKVLLGRKGLSLLLDPKRHSAGREQPARIIGEWLQTEAT